VCYLPQQTQNNVSSRLKAACSRAIYRIAAGAQFWRTVLSCHLLVSNAGTPYMCACRINAQPIGYWTALYVVPPQKARLHIRHTALALFKACFLCMHTLVREGTCFGRYTEAQTTANIVEYCFRREADFLAISVDLPRCKSMNTKVVSIIVYILRRFTCIP
jgi:hypothetical protein